MNRLLQILTAVGFLSTNFAQRQEKIVGGYEAFTGEFPFVASIRYDFKHFCGGSIISDYHVLTAAHCVEGHTSAPYNNARVVTGTTDSVDGGWYYEVGSIVQHTSYEPNNPASPYDIAVIEVKYQISFDDNTKVISLATSPPPNGAPALAIGWGLQRKDAPMLSRSLYKVPLTILTPDRCQQYHTDPLYDHQICAGGPPGSGVCQGDSGGPLIYKRQLIGIVSWGKPCAVGIPDVFTSVHYWGDWVKTILYHSVPVVLQHN